MAPKKRRATRRATFVPLKTSEKKQIREFARYIPSLENYVGKSRISSAEYGAFKRAKKKLRHTENLKPLTEKQAKALRGKLVGGGIRAIRLRNTGGDVNVKVKAVLKGGIVVTTNGRDWEYHPVSGGGDIDEVKGRLIEAARKLFNRPKAPPWAIGLWTSKGRASELFSSFEAWANYILSRFNKYQNAEEYIWGIAALVKDKGGKIRSASENKIPKNNSYTEEAENEEEEE